MRSVSDHIKNDGTPIAKDTDSQYCTFDTLSAQARSFSRENIRRHAPTAWQTRETNHQTYVSTV
jgi:hypothetical protein